MIDLFERFKGKGSEGITLGDLQHLVYTFRSDGEKDFTIGGDDNPIT